MLSGTTANASASGIMDFVVGGHHHHRTASDTASGTSSTSGKPGKYKLLNTTVWKQFYLEIPKIEGGLPYYIYIKQVLRSNLF